MFTCTNNAAYLSTVPYLAQKLPIRTQIKKTQEIGRYKKEKNPPAPPPRKLKSKRMQNTHVYVVFQVCILMVVCSGLDLLLKLLGTHFLET